MILLVHPNEEILLVVVPYPSSVKPVSGHPRCQQEGRDRLVEEKVVINELLLFRFRHALERVVFATQLSTKAIECLDHNLEVFGRCVYFP